MALKDLDDSGEHQIIDPALGGFRQAYELWVCHAQLPDVELSEQELTTLLTRPYVIAAVLRRLELLRELSHLTWHWVEAPAERQFDGDRYLRMEARPSVVDGVWFRPAHRVAGWVRDDTVTVDSAVRTMVPVDNIGWYATQGVYRDERWLFATGETPDLARLGIDERVGEEVGRWRELVAEIDAARAAMTTEIPQQARPAREKAPEDGWMPPGIPEMRGLSASLTLPQDGRTRWVPNGPGQPMLALDLGEPTPLPVLGFDEVLREPVTEPQSLRVRHGDVERWEPITDVVPVVTAHAPVEPKWRQLLARGRKAVISWTVRPQDIENPQLPPRQIDADGSEAH